MLAPCWRHVVPFKSQFVKSVNITSISLGFMIHMGVSENSVPHCTQWLMIIIPIKWLVHWEYTLFSDKPIYQTSLLGGDWKMF